MTTPRETRTTSSRRNVAPRPSDAARRQREHASVVLAQIVARATRIRQLSPTLDVSNNSPLTLIELIQASSAVFEKHGIQAPDDVVFHRHLLTLSLDPEPDWKKKIQRFAVQRSSSEVGFSPATSSVGSMKRRTSRTISDGSHSLTRRPSDRSTSRTSTRQSKDQFGDVLARTNLKEGEVRGGSTVEAAPKLVEERKPVMPAQKLRHLETIRATLNAINDELTLEGEREEDGDDLQDDDVESYSATSVNEVEHSVTASDRVSVLIPPHAYYPSPAASTFTADDARSLDTDSPIERSVEPRDHAAARFMTSQFRHLSTTFQQWKELTTFHRLVRDSRQREMRLTQAVLPPIATFAIFRWIGVTLPVRTGDSPAQLTLAVPAYVTSRGVTTSNPRLLRHFTGRLLVWTIHRVFKAWASSSRAIKTVRIKSLIRMRTELLETAFNCLHQWRRFVRYQRRTSDHGVWVETLHARKCLRQSLHVWQNELKVRNRELSVVDVYRRRIKLTVVRSWRQWATQCYSARHLGSRRVLQRLLRSWKNAIRWSEEEHRQIVRARSHFAHRMLKHCWSVWCAQKSILKLERLRVVKATRYHHKKIVHRVWKTWQESHRKRSSLEQKCIRFNRRRQQRLLRSILVKFAGYVQGKKCNTLIVMDASARRDERLIKRFWKAWRTHFHMNQEEDNKRISLLKLTRTIQVLTLWRRRTSLMKLSAILKSCFDVGVTQKALLRWKSWVEKRRSHRLLVLNWRGIRDQVLLKQVFKSLQENMKVGLVKLHAVQGFLSRYSDTRLQSYVWAWREITKARRIKHLHDDVRRQDCERLQLRSRWATWRQAFHVVRCVAIADVAMAQGIRRRYFQLWFKLVRSRQGIQSSTAHLRRYQLRTAIHKLNCQAKTNRSYRQIATTVSKRGNALMIRRGWTVWRSAFNTAKHRHTRATQAILQWQNKQVALYFVVWKAAYASRRQLRVLLSRWQQKTNARSIHGIWKAWQEYIAFKHDKRLAVAESQHYFEQRALKRAIDHWQEKSMLSQNQLRVMQKCFLHWTNGLKFRMFTQWKAFVRLRRMVKVMDSRATNKLVQRCFFAWCKWKYRRDLAALESDECVSRLQHWTMRRAVRRLRQHAIIAKRVSSLEGLVRMAGTRGVQTALFRRWIRYTLAARQQKADARVQALKMQQFRQRRCVQQWDQFVRVKKLMTSTLSRAKAHSKNELLGRMFTQWRKFMVDRRMYNALKDKALVFQVLSMKPTHFYAWKRYWTDQLRKRQLYAKASRQFCYQRESRAFKSWRLFAVEIKQLRQAIRQWQNQSLQNRFGRWKTYLGLQNGKARAIAHHNSRTSKHIMHEWHRAARRERLLRHFTHIWGVQTTERCFRLWARHIQMIKSARALLRRLQHSTLTRVLNSWKSLADKERLQTGQIRRRFTMMWNQDRVMTCFQRWKALSARQQLLKKRLLQQMCQETSMCFDRWRAYAANRKVLSNRGVHVRNHHERIILRDSWSQWKKKKLIYGTASLLRRRIMRQCAETSLRIFFVEWVKFSRRVRTVKATMRQYFGRRLKLIFSCWRDQFVARRKREHLVGCIIQKRHEASLVKGVILRMQARLTIKNACTRVFLPQLQRHVLTAAWQSWRLYHGKKRGTKERVQTLRLRIAQYSMHKAAIASLTRWHALQEAQCFVHWSTVSQHLKWMRCHTAEAIEFWRNRLCLAIFRSWVTWLRDRKQKKKLQASGSRHRQLRAWMLWTKYHQHQNLQTFLHEKAVLFHQRSLKISVISQWQKILQRNRHYRLLAASLMVQRTLLSVRKWHRFAVYSRSRQMQLTVAIAAARHTRLSNSWKQWKLFVTQVRMHRLELQRHTERLQVLVMCSTFRAWHAWSQRQSKTKRILSALTDRCDIETAKRALRSWTNYAKNASSRRLMVIRYAWTSQVRRGFQALRVHAKEQITKRRVTQKAREWFEVLQGRFMRRSFQRWLRYVILTKKTRLAIRRYRLENLLPQVFNAWKRFIRMKHTKDKRLEKAVQCWRSVFARRAWIAWYEYYTRHRSKRCGLTKALIHFQMRLLGRITMAWRGEVAKKRYLSDTCRRLLVRWKMQIVYRSFTTWNSYVLRRKTNLVSAAVVSSRRVNTQLRQVWGEWRIQFVVARVGVRQQTAKAFDRWHHWIQQRRKWVEYQAAQSQALLRNVRARHGVQRWKTFVVETKMAKTMALLSGRFSADTLLKRYFEKWLQYLVTRRRVKGKMKHILVWLRNRQLMQYFHALSKYSTVQKHMKRCQDLASKHFIKQTKRKSLIGWKDTVSVAQNQRLKLRQYVDIMQHVSQRKSFVAWREFASRRGQLRATYANLLSQRAQLTSRAVVDEWKMFTAKMRQRKVANQYHRHHVGVKVLKQWHSFVILCRVERMLGASGQRVVEHCFLEWRKRAVLHKQVRSLGQDKRERDTKDLLIRHMIAWRDWTRLHTKCAKLLGSVAIGYHLRYRFLMWNMYVEKNKRLKRLVLRSQPQVINNDTIGTSNELVAIEQPSLRLARMARFFHQLQVDWNDTMAVWQRWRHAFHARLFYRMRQLYKTFTAWQTWSRRRRLIRTICSSRLEACRAAQKRTLFLRWREVVGTVKRIQRERIRERELLVIVNTELLRRERRLLQQHWNAWRERTENKRHLLVSVDSYQRARLLTKYWLLWSHDFVRVMKLHHQNDARYNNQLAALKARRAIVCLREHRDWSVKARHAVSAVRMSRSMRYHQLCFDQWKVFADTKRRARLLVVFKKRQTTCRAFQAWRTWLERRQLQESAIDNFTQRRRFGVRMRAFKNWRVYVCSRQRHDQAMILATRFHLRRCVRSRWHQAVQRQIHRRQMLQQQQIRFSLWRQHRAVIHWHVVVHNNKLRKRQKMFALKKHFQLWKLFTHQLLADRFWAYLELKHMRSAFAAWGIITHRQNQLRGIETQLTAQSVKRRQQQVWTAWQKIVESKRNQRDAIDYYNGVLKHKYLTLWFDVTNRMRMERNQRLAVADEFRVYSIKRLILRNWVVTLVRARQRKAVLLTCVVKIQQAYSKRLQQAILHAWADASDLERFTRECASILQYCRVQRSIQRWRKKIVDRRRLEQLERDALVYHHNRLLSGVFFHWQNYALAWKDAAKAHFSAHEVAITPSPPVEVEATIQNFDSDDDATLRFRRPLSPMKKRFQAKRLVSRAGDLLSPSSLPMESFADAVSLSLNVKKRLLVLGKWKPTHKSLSQV